MNIKEKNREKFIIITLVILTMVICYVSFITLNLFTGKKVDAQAKVGLFKKYTAYFHMNGDGSYSGGTVSCTAILGSCNIKVPVLKTKNGYSKIGWSTNKNDHSASVKEGLKIKIKKDIHFYAITSKTLKATFYDDNLDYLETKNRSCTVYNNEKKCDILLPVYNKSGRFNLFWSKDKIGMNNLYGKLTERSKHFIPVLGSISINDNITLYPNYNSLYYDNINEKYRNIKIIKSKRYGKVIVDYDRELTKSQINEMDNSLNVLASKMPWLLVPSKVFVFSHKNKLLYSGTTKGVTFFYKDVGALCTTIDIDADLEKYDSTANMLVVTLHELAHTLDWRYNLTVGKGSISDTDELKQYFKSIETKVDLHGVGTYSKDDLIEFFARMVNNYAYYKYGIGKQYYALKKGKTLTKSEMIRFEKLLDIWLKTIGVNGGVGQYIK